MTALINREFLLHKNLGKHREKRERIMSRIQTNLSEYRDYVFGCVFFVLVTEQWELSKSYILDLFSP